MGNKRLSSCVPPSALLSSTTEDTSNKMVSPFSEENGRRKGSKRDNPSFSENKKVYENKNSIELATYDEGKFLGKAMRKLQNMYGHGFQEESQNGNPRSVEIPHTESSSSSYLSPSTEASFFSSPPRRTLPPFPHHSRAASSNSPPNFGSLSSELLIRCFSFCPLKTLVDLSCVNRRFHALSCTNSLWIPFASFFGVKLRSEEDWCQVKERIRECVIAQRRVKEQEMRHCKEEYALLKRRIKAKSDAIRATPIDVDATLQESSSLYALQKRLSVSEGGNSATRDASVEMRVSGDFVFNLQEALTELDSVRAQLLDRLENNNVTLKRHEKYFFDLQRSLEVYRHRGVSGSNSTTFFESTTAGTAVEQASGNSSSFSPNSRKNSNLHDERHPSDYLRNCDDPQGQKNEGKDFPPLSFEEVLAFERRMVKLVINGKGLAPSTAHSGVEPFPVGIGKEDGRHRSGQGADTETREDTEKTNELSSWMTLSPVFRRGIQDFGSLELLLCVSSDAAVTSSVLKEIQKRYDAFKRFFPLNEDYYTLKSIVSAQSRCSTEVFSTESESGSLNDGGASVTTNIVPITTTASVPQKYKSLYNKLTLLIRHIQRVKDSGVLSTLL